QAWVGGPALLVVFGMAGLESTVWARYLAADSPDLLRRVLSSGEKWFIMSEWDDTPSPPARPIDLDEVLQGYTRTITLLGAATRCTGSGRWRPVPSPF